MSQGAWHFVHGHAGQVENKDTTYGLQAMGWGLSFHQVAGTSNYVHFAIPSNALYGWRADHLHLQFTCGEFAQVTEVTLWDGKQKFKEVPLEFKEGEVDVLINLEGEWEIQRGLGLSLKLEADEAGDAHFMFHAAGANFRQ